MSERSPGQPAGGSSGGGPTRGRRTSDKAAAADNARPIDVGSEQIPPAVGSAPKPVGPRRERYLVAHLGAPPGGMLDTFSAGPMASPAGLLAQLAADPSCTVHRVITPTTDLSQGPALATLSAFASGTATPAVPAFPHVAVVEMEADRAHMFAAAGPMVHVEPDAPLQYTAPDPTAGLTFADPGVIPPGDDTSVIFSVVGSDGKALEGAEVYLMNDAFPVRGVTGPDGTVALVTPAGALPALRGIYVKPRYDYWAIWLGSPELSLEAPNLVTCPAFTETFPGFPERQLDGWARRAMRFDALPPTFRGHGVKIAIIDSGAAVEHPDLAGRITSGRDIPGHNDTGWKVDTVGHGSHCAGSIGGSDNGYGIVGVVPEAEIHSCKIFPGGRFSDLIEALDYCIANKIDVVNLSLGSPQPSELIARKIEHARQAGIACVVAAGNSSGPVAFPANMRGVLAVAAIGKAGEYPPESYHATEVYGNITPEGYFSASFTCFGPEVDVCAPGVAIVSSVPPTNYAAWDGTSMAAPFVTGLAALLLAHHPDFRDRYGHRDANRVDHLFELIRGSCRPLQLGDPGRSGAGLPDAVAALGLVAPVTMTPPSHPLLASLWAAMAHAGLVPANLPTVPAGSLGTGSLPAAAAATMLAAEATAVMAPFASQPFGGAWAGPTGTPAWAGPTSAPWASLYGWAGPTGGNTAAWAGAPSPAWAGPTGAPSSAWAGPTGTPSPAWAGPTGAPSPAWAGPTGAPGMPATAAPGTSPEEQSAPPATTTLTATSTDALSPLRAAMKAAGLLPRDAQGAGTEPG